MGRHHHHKHHHHKKHKKYKQLSSSSSSSSSSEMDEWVEKVNDAQPDEKGAKKREKRHKHHHRRHRSRSSNSLDNEPNPELMEVTENPSEANLIDLDSSQGKCDKKNKKERKHRKHCRERKRRHRSSSSSSTSSSSSEEDVEKQSKVKSKRWKKKRHSSTSSTSSSSSSSDSDHRRRRHRKKRGHHKRRHSSTSSSTSTSSSSSESDNRRKKDKKAHKNCRKGDKKDKQRSPAGEHPSPLKENFSLQENLSTQENPSIQENPCLPENRDEWMNLPTNFLSESNLDRRQEKEERKKRDQERKQYNPRECARELNPYWKNGGDGLPNFQKPSDEFDDSQKNRSSSGTKKQSWRKKPEEKYTKLLDSDFKSEVVKPDSTVQNDDDENEIISEKELNAIAAKLVKAEIMGNSKLIDELKEKLDSARRALKTQKIDLKPEEEEEIILTHTDGKGVSRPLKSTSDSYFEKNSGKRSEKKKRVATHDASGDRVRYFADDDRFSLKEMFENEKYNTTESSNNEFIKLAGKSRKNDDLDDVFSDNIRKKEADGKKEARDRDRAISDHKKLTKSLDKCSKCLQSKDMQKHLMISVNETVYLALPAHEPLVEHHCLIIPIRHVNCSTQLDENEFEDLQNVQKALIRMYKAQNLDCVFFEIAMNLQRYPHMAIECVPLEKEQGDLAPIYFKKAIDESETEWAQNKKLVSLRGKNVRRAIPKGLPYFSVTFALDDGFAHVIEDEQVFPANFAQEIIGGMLDLHHSKWRRPKREKFEEQKKRVLEFSKIWAPFDCSKN